jgi:hypothetical protein
VRFVAETKAILDQIEALSGRPVRFMEERDLPVLSTLRVARDGASFHVLRYRPSDEPLDYRVAYQAAYTLRLFQCPEGERFDFVPLPEAHDAARELVAAGMPLTDQEKSALGPLSAAVADWALLQLRSLPVGMRIDRWIRHTMPVLRSQQEAVIGEVQQQNLEATTKAVGRLTVPRHLAATNAAHALFADQLLGREWFAIPYRAMGLTGDGNRLLSLLGEVPADPRHDRQLIDSWADDLGMRGWYRWAPYRP